MNPLSQNLYVYCGNNPVAYVDPSGHIRLCQMQDNAQSIADWLNNLNDKYIGGPLNQIASGDYTPIENFALNNSPAVNMIEGIRGRTVFTGKDLSNEERQARIDNFNTMMAEGMIFMSVGGKSPTKGSGITGRTFKDLLTDIEKNPKAWKVTRESVVESTKKGNKGGVSIERELTNTKTGEKLFEHILIDSKGKLIEQPHYRPYGKQ